MTSKFIEGHKSSSNFSVNSTLPLMISPHYVSSSQPGSLLKGGGRDGYLFCALTYFLDTAVFPHFSRDDIY